MIIFQEKIKNLEADNERLKTDLSQVKSESIMIIKTLNDQNTHKDKQIEDLIQDSSKCLQAFESNISLLLIVRV